MSDCSKGATAWQIDPQTYLESRLPTHRLPHMPASQYLKMDDGIRLALDVYLPDGDRPAAGFSTILIFTPYYRRFALKSGARNTIEASPNIAAYRDMFVPRGYALVVVDVRGTGASFGTRDSFRSPSEVHDYNTIMDWVTAQSWCDGNLGATGISYLGAACDFAASTGHRGLKAIAPISAVWDTYKDQFYPGGILLTNLARGYEEIMHALDQDDRAALANYSYFSDPDLAGPAPVDEDHDGADVRVAIQGHIANIHIPDFIREFQFRDDHLAHDPTFTTDAFSPHAYSPSIRDDVAILSISGWMDGAYCNGAISRYLTMTRNPNRYLLLGPWDHGARVNVSPFRDAATPEFPILGAILRFFDEHVAGGDTGLSKEAPIHIHTMRSETWMASRQWPPVDRNATFYLGGDHTLSEAAGENSEIEYTVDYASGTGQNTRYGRLQVRNVQDYYSDWQPDAPTRLLFRSEPISRGLTIAGHPLVTLQMSSDQQDACVFVYLEDLQPDGTARYITEGMLRALHRRESPPSNTYATGWPHRDFKRRDALPLEINTFFEMSFAMLPTSWRVPPGHRIGLSIAGADRDNFALWPYGRPGHWKIRTGQHHPSKLVLPAVAD
jgi:putative CocE/NonD family hydrolase